MITVEHLTKRYGAVTAVEDISFTIEDGHIYGFLGPNGAGKSTTMNIMTGCLAATSGEVKIDGYDIFEQARQAFAAEGYQLPQVVFWDVASRGLHQPVTMNEQGAALVSGCTPKLFQMVTSGELSPYAYMLDVLSEPRYRDLTA